ncbi:glycosyltransferase [Pseudomonas asiatica]|uniref:glycosyltransferase n=1 Tax=Pseudomonas asiatica TaxID=2219225 RepID=UPI002367A327|nr:glycosyltransferase [Pseudomonas asiatica]WDM87923.1 glycosyltransferase [Pseudomonas asiatica]
MRELLAKRPQPYYIYAPNYRRSSSGIRVLHMLCDALIRSGYEAYVTAEELCSEFMTPRLTDAVIEAHRAQGVEPIVVYPEIVDGNPLQGGVVVRYIMNRPGFIEGEGQFAEEDILYAYSRDLLQENMPDDRVMLLPPFDRRVFCLPDNPEKRIPGKVCYYQGRRGELSVDLSMLPPDAVEITPQWPASWAGLADLFQQCETFYCCGSSALATEAGLCGCLTVVIVKDDAPRIGIAETQSPGAAWGTAPEELKRARESLPSVHDIWKQLEVDFWPALDHFIEVTQSAATEHAAQKGRRQLLPWLAGRSPSDTQRRLIGEHLAVNPEPAFSVLVLDREGDDKLLAKTIKSLDREHNLHGSTHILVLTTASAPQASSDAALRFLNLDPEQPLRSIEQALREDEADWFMLVEAGSEFTPSGLLIAALDLLAAPDCRAVYGDQVVREQSGEMGAVLRPDLNLDLLLSLPAAIAGHWLFNRQVWLDMGGFRQEAGKAFELDYILRLIESAGFEGLGHISEPLLISDARPLRDCPDEREVIQRHLQARGFSQARIGSRLPGRYDLDYGAPGDVPVSILILLQGKSTERAQRCVESILEKTAYRNYEVLLLALDNASSAVNSWLDGVARLGTDAIRCMRFPAGTTPVAMRNQAAGQARGDFLLWLDEGAAVLDNDWLQQMLNHGMRQEVGVVGAKLVAGDATISHAGFVLGLNGPVGEAFVGQPMDAPGYLQRLQVDQNYVAVSGKCLLVNKGLFLEAGGFDETPELQRWTDVDLCLRLYRGGYLNVWTSRVQLLLSEDAASPASTAEEDALYDRWLPALARDPFYNPNFSLSSTNGFGLAPAPLSWRPLSSWKPLPTILAYAADSQGCGNYRVIQPLETLNREGLAEGMLSESLLTLTELERYQPDSIVLQRQVDDEQIECMRRMQAFSRAFKVFELDDYLPNLPMKSVHKAHMPKDILRSIRRGLAYVDRFVVSTQPLAEAFAGLHDDIQVVQNTLDTRYWKDLKALRRQSRKPRVGWAGGASHTGDLEVIADVVKELANEVEWVFFGMCPDKLRPYVHEYYEGVSIEQYPAMLAKMNLDLALAPVEQNLFNECKSNLRLLEYGACGFPVIASDVRCYQGYHDLPVTLVKNRFRGWVDAIRMHIADLDATAKAGDALRNAVLGGWMLEGDNLASWRKAWLPG